MVTPPLNNCLSLSLSLSQISLLSSLPLRCHLPRSPVSRCKLTDQSDREAFVPGSRHVQRYGPRQGPIFRACPCAKSAAWHCCDGRHGRAAGGEWCAGRECDPRGDAYVRTPHSLIYQFSYDVILRTSENSTQTASQNSGGLHECVAEQVLRVRANRAAEAGGCSARGLWHAENRGYR